VCGAYDPKCVARTKDPEKTLVVFLDDTLGSGNQGITIFREWLGLSNEPTRHVHRLSKEAEEWLRKVHLAYFAVVCFREGKEKLTDYLASQGLAIRI
jgi:hypothetical protein